MKVHELIKLLSKSDPNFDVDIVDSDESCRNKIPEIKLESNEEEKLCLIHWSDNFKSESMENWFPNSE